VELKLGPLLRQATPVDVKDIAVVVVLGKGILGQLPRRLGQLGALSDGHSFHLVVIISQMSEAPVEATNHVIRRGFGTVEPVTDFVFKTRRAQSTTPSTATPGSPSYMETLLMGPERVEVLSTRPRELTVL
jgi:hypothetical protein